MDETFLRQEFLENTWEMKLGVNDMGSFYIYFIYNNNNFIYTPDSEVKLCSVVLTITITYSKTSRIKNVNTFINYLYCSKSDQVYNLK